MNCPKCNAQNIQGSSFCIKCGANLKESNVNNEPVQNMQSEVAIPPMINNVQVETNISHSQTIAQQPFISSPQTIQMQQTASVTPQKTVGDTIAVYKNYALNYIMYIITFLLKPFKTFSEEEEKLSDTKTSFILALIVSTSMTVINLITTMLNTVRQVSYYSKEVTWEWGNLKELNYLELIGKNFLIYSGIILAIAAVFYVGSLIIKKEIKFTKMLSLSATSIIPAVVCAMFISPIAGLIWNQLSMPITIIGLVYTFIIIYELMNRELGLDGDIKLYFNLACFGVLVIAGYYAYMKLVVSYQIDELLNLFQ